MKRENSIFIIAEAGVNHNGSLKLAKRLVDAAVDSGADAVKFQTFKTEKVIAINAPKPAYQIKNTLLNESQYEMAKKLELKPKDFITLFSYCARRKIIFMSTPFDNDSVDLLDDLGMRIFKVPSGEIINKKLIEHIAAKNKPVMLSTGMSYMEEVAQAVRWINHSWSRLKKKPSITLLHCVSNYPAAIEDVNLLSMKAMKDKLRLPVGYSDHTVGIVTSIAAAGLGAKVLEKHFTLDRTLSGPDHKASLEPDELHMMIKAVRDVEKMMGDGIKRPVKSEEPMRLIIRRSLFTTRDIDKNAIIKPEDVIAKRPGIGIGPQFCAQVINMRAKCDIPADSIVRWRDLINA